MKYALLLCIILTGCATCREDKVACAIAVGSVVIAGSVIASQHSREHDRPRPRMWE
jgi:hypothetical protein